MPQPGLWRKTLMSSVFDDIRKCSSLGSIIGSLAEDSFVPFDKGDNPFWGGRLENREGRDILVEFSDTESTFPGFEGQLNLMINTIKFVI